MVHGYYWQPLAWLKLYFSSRSQIVSINGQHSDHLSITSGVSQGSILGPLLFFVFVNNLPEFVKSAKPSLFADDTIINVPNQFPTLQNVLSYIRIFSKW